MKTRPDSKKPVPFSESVATDKLESVVKTHATNWLFPCELLIQTTPQPKGQRKCATHHTQCGPRGKAVAAKKILCSEFYMNTLLMEDLNLDNELLKTKPGRPFHSATHLFRKTLSY